VTRASSFRYVVYGAGAVGGCFGGLLRHAGRNVVLVARSAHAAAIRANGLQLKSPGESLTITVPVVEDVAELNPQTGDVILLGVKSPQTESSIARLAAVFPPETPIVCMQNGVRNEEIAAKRFANVYGALVLFNAVMPAPGVVARTLTDVIVIGRFPQGADNLTAQFVADAQVATFPAQENPDVMSVKWGKLIGNLNNAALATIDCYWQKAFANSEIMNLMKAIMAEGLRTLAAAGISPADVTGRFDIRAQVEAYAARAGGSFQELPPHERAYPSMWQDLNLRRETTEAEQLNGEIVALGRQYGVPTPINGILLSAVRDAVQAQSGPGRFSLAQLTEMIEARKRETHQ
jgi:2-dehydropantoate 2-reductase